ncbi:MAG: hypothetical protein ACUVTP_08645 [Candidatus Fervidibacter sp.]|uniref:hypothetical protein n=1 Tax=Candidatus Fervidibacter sp. TaxID=3100871 RepID=UPI00404AAAB9
MRTTPSLPVFHPFLIAIDQISKQKSIPSQQRATQVSGNWEKIDNSFRWLKRLKAPAKRIRQVKRESAAPNTIKSLTVLTSLQKEYERLAEEMKCQR